MTDDQPTNGREIHLFLSTWNVGNEAPENMDKLLPGFNSTEAFFYDLIVLGFQESTYPYSGDDGDKSTGKGAISGLSELKKEKHVTGLAKFVKHSVEPCIKHMQNLIMSTLDPTGEHYEMVEHNRRAQMQLYVIAKKSLIPFISQVEKNAENTGFMHVFPNKGGLLVSLNIDGTSLAFVSCHLTAHEGVSNCQFRNDSIKEILGGVRPRDKRYDIFAQCHHIFWMGDMNYRLTFNSKDLPVETHHRSQANLSPQPISPRQSREFGHELKYDHDGYPISPASSTPRSNKSPALTPTESRRGPGYGDFEDKDSDDEVDVGVDMTLTQDRKSKKALRFAEMNKIYRMICDEKWPELLKLDELNRELAAGRVLHGFTALQPSWPPTFKRHRHIGITRCMYDLSGPSNGDAVWDIAYHDCILLSKGGSRNAGGAESNAAVSDSDQFFGSNPRNSETSLITGEVSLADNLSDVAYNSIINFYHKKRLPSYTDRILYKSWESYATNLVNNGFESVEEVLSSDHKPVRASFTLTTTLGLKSINVFYEERERQRFFSSRHIESSSPTKNLRNSVLGRQPSAGSLSGGSAHSERSSVILAKYQHMSVRNLISTDISFATLESSIESHHTKVFSKIRFEFYNLHGINLAEKDSAISGGKSDPYIVLSADPTVLGYNPKYEKEDSMFTSCHCAGIGYSTHVHEVRSSIMAHNLNPVWEDQLNLTVLSFDVYGLIDNLNFVLAVWDYDRFKEDNIIGTCVISFKDMIPYLTKARPEERKYYFDKQLVDKGIVMGRIKGAVRVPDRSLEYFIQENTACWQQSTAIDEAQGHRYHRPPVKQGSFGSVGTTSPRGGNRDLQRSPSSMTRDDFSLDQESKCLIM